MTFDNRCAVVGVIVAALCTSQWLPQVFNTCSLYKVLASIILTCDDDDDDDERMSRVNGKSSFFVLSIFPHSLLIHSIFSYFFLFYSVVAACAVSVLFAFQLRQQSTKKIA